MEKVYNEEWMKDILGRSKEAMDDSSGSLPEIDWVQYKKGFKKSITFKLMPANMKENNVFSAIVATHWIQMPDGKAKRFICPEETVHLKGQHVKCPVCEAKRKLKAMGFTDEQLSVQGKFGLMPVFDPKFTSNAKVVVLQSDEKQDWDRAHVPVLQQNGTFMTVWLAQKYASNETPNFTAITSSNPIKFSRPTDSGKWEREFSFSMFTPSEEVAAKLRDENEALTLPDLWKMPTDQEFIEMSRIMDEMKNNYIAARDTMNGNSNSSVIEEDDLDIPF